jgi:hypothetical protein
MRLNLALAVFLFSLATKGAAAQILFSVWLVDASGAPPRRRLPHSAQMRRAWLDNNRGFGLLPQGGHQSGRAVRLR